MIQDMISGMMGGMGLIAILMVIVMVLGAAAMVK
jgi:hypothetical protein